MCVRQMNYGLVVATVMKLDQTSTLGGGSLVEGSSKFGRSLVEVSTPTSFKIIYVT